MTAAARQRDDRRSSAEQRVGGRVLPPLEPAVLEGGRRRQSRGRVPVQTARHEVDQLRVVAVVEGRVERPRRRHAAHLAPSRPSGRQLAEAGGAGASTVPAPTRSRTLYLSVLTATFPGVPGLTGIRMSPRIYWMDGWR